MAVYGLDLAATLTHELSFDPDKGKPEATKFTIGTLDSRLVGWLRDSANRITVDTSSTLVDTKVDQHALNFQACQAGLRGWTNLALPSGTAIEFKTAKVRIAGKDYEVVADDVLRLLPLEAITELGDVILRRNEVTASEAKN